MVGSNGGRRFTAIEACDQPARWALTRRVHQRVKSPRGREVVIVARRALNLEGGEMLVVIDGTIRPTLLFTACPSLIANLGEVTDEMADAGDLQVKFLEVGGLDRFSLSKSCLQLRSLHRRTHQALNLNERVLVDARGQILYLVLDPRIERAKLFRGASDGAIDSALLLCNLGIESRQTLYHVLCDLGHENFERRLARHEGCLDGRLHGSRRRRRHWDAEDDILVPRATGNGPLRDGRRRSLKKR
jgi:hypothetical protein